MFGRRASALLLPLVALACAGCYGSTEPASDIGVNSATFNGVGTTNSGSARVWFEYWPTAAPAHIGSTGALAHHIPGGVSGPVADTTVGLFGGLEPATRYAVRLCGEDDGAQRSVCAQTRTFTTVRPAGDVVVGFFNGPFGHEAGSVDARSTGSGADPGGTLSLPSVDGGVDGHVTCVRVHGDDAAVGAVGTDDTGSPVSEVLAVHDGGIEHNGELGGGDGVGWKITPGSAPPDCGRATVVNLGEPEDADLAVYDAL